MRNDDDDNNNEEDSSLDLENISSSQNDVRFDQRDSNKKPRLNHKKRDIHSLEDCSIGDDRNYQTEDSQFHTSPFRDDGSSLVVKQLLNSTSDCTFDAFANKTDPLSSQILVDLNSAHFSDTSCSLNTGTDDDLHYKKTVAAVLGGSSKFIGRVSFQDGQYSSFVPWKKEPEHRYRATLSPQKMVKEILFNFPVMYSDCSSLESSHKWFGKKLQSDFNGNYSKQREEQNLLVLRSKVPSINKSDEESVRSNTIRYLRELEERVGELESRTSLMKSLEIVEQTSDNCATKKMRLSKRKACGAEENDSVRHDSVSHGVDLKVRVKKDQEVLIQMKCRYKEYILVNIMDAISRLHLDSRLVRSSTLDGVFTLILRAKFRGTEIAPVGMIKQALWKVASKC